MATLVDERALDERLAGLEAARPWSPRVVSRLEALIREGDDAALFRVNPFALAKQRDLDPGEATDLMLHATAQGLFDMDWLLICPRCACAVESFDQAARGAAPVPLPAVPQRVRGRDGRLHRDLLQRLAADLRHPLPPTGDARSIRLHVPLPRRSRRAPPERRAVHRIRARGVARDRASWRPRARPASRSMPRLAWSPESAPTPKPASRYRSKARR